MHIPSPRSSRKARIEIIPLIDIIFFLLATFVMVSLSMVKNHAIPVNLPSAATGAAQDRTEFTSISISAEGDVFFNKQRVSSEELAASLKSVIAADPDPKVFISGDARAEYGKAIAVLDQVRKLGITRIAIETVPPSPAPAP